MTQTLEQNFTLSTDHDLHHFTRGIYNRIQWKLGAHPRTIDGIRGACFGVWAPNAERISVIGDFNGWDRWASPLSPHGGFGVWEAFVPDAAHGSRYKYHIVTRNGREFDKADPFAFRAERPPATASVVWDLTYRWNDSGWMGSRSGRPVHATPVSIYEIFPAGWRRVPEEGHRPLSYRELAPRLSEYARQMNFTHIELTPILEHPFDGSWGYQPAGYFAPTSRYGTPQDFMFLVDHLHQNGIGVILDWVPSHFAVDEHALALFDGTHLFEDTDPAVNFHPTWGSWIFNHGRKEVRNFLLSSAFHWIETYHVDGLRVDAVASMLHNDDTRGGWGPSQERQRGEVIEFLRLLNEEIGKSFPNTLVIAEESFAWPKVTRPPWGGGLGFTMKWDLGWMYETLHYLMNDPLHRKHHQWQLTKRMEWAFMENFTLPLSHDDSAPGKRSILEKMPGDDWQKFANVRLLYSYMFGMPGKKLLFMGDEFAQRREWVFSDSLDWHLLSSPAHAGVKRLVEDLNRLYREQPALHQKDFDPSGYEWVDANDTENSVLCFLRKGATTGDLFLVVCNFTPVVRHDYRVGVPREGRWREIFNSDASIYGGSGQGNLGGVDASPVPCHGRPHSVTLTLPPLAAVYFKWPA